MQLTKQKQKSGTVENCFLPDAIFTTDSIIGSLTGTLDVFMGSRRPITPLLSWNKKGSIILSQYMDVQYNAHTENI